MLGLFRRPKTAAKRPAGPRRARLALESLEGRDCPSTGFTSFSDTPQGGGLVQLSGYVAASNPSGVTVSFTGAAQGQATPDASGYFSFRVSGTGGTVDARAADMMGTVLGTAEASPTDSSPGLTLTATVGQNQTITLSGRVTSGQPGGAGLSGVSVAFSGAAAGSALTDAYGNFTYQTMASAGGTVRASVTDAAGLTSSASAQVTSGSGISPSGNGTSGGTLSGSTAPVVTSFQSTEGTGHSWTFTGHVQDSNLMGLQVHFGGLASLVGQTATVGADGNFSLTATLQPAEDGRATAQATDAAGLNSNTATTLVTEAPAVSFSIAYGQQHMVTLSGRVTDEHPGGLTVNFGGVVTGSAVTNADGTFSITLQASALGQVQAMTTDTWGVGSAVASATVANGAPQLVAVSAVEGTNNVWTIQGTVSDECAQGLTVSFSGLPSVEGKTATVSSNGTFCLIVTLQPGECGTISALTTDWWDTTSNLSSWDISPS
jgi:hypothetical protein